MWEKDRQTTKTIPGGKRKKNERKQIILKSLDKKWK